MRVAATVHAPCVLVLLSSQADISAGVNSILGGILFLFKTVRVILLEY